MKILITGHRGFVGRHFTERLYDGNDVTGIDVTEGIDARDFFRRDQTRFDLVVHLAAVVGGRATIEGAPLDVAVDLAIDAELFGWAVRTKPRRVIYYSSSAAYPTWLQQGSSRAKLAEHMLYLDRSKFGAPDMTYGWAKLTGELLARHAEEAGVRVHVFRPFSGYGEDQDESYPFRAFVERARRREDPFLIWGDGEQVRDFVHIDDVVSATLEAVTQDVPGPVNLCTGVPTSMNALAEMATSEVGYAPRYRHETSAPSGVRYRVGDPAKMLTFYEPRVTIREGVRRALTVQ